MSVGSYSVKVFVCRCDVCGATDSVEEYPELGIYNGAQAVRSLGWSFGKSGRVLCGTCRPSNINWNDKYTKRAVK